MGGTAGSVRSDYIVKVLTPLFANGSSFPIVCFLEPMHRLIVLWFRDLHNMQIHVFWQSIKVYYQVNSLHFIIMNDALMGVKT